MLPFTHDKGSNLREKHRLGVGTNFGRGIPPPTSTLTGTVQGEGAATPPPKGEGRGEGITQWDNAYVYALRQNPSYRKTYPPTCAGTPSHPFDKISGACHSRRRLRRTHVNSSSSLNTRSVH